VIRLLEKLDRQRPSSSTPERARLDAFAVLPAAERVAAIQDALKVVVTLPPTEANVVFHKQLLRRLDEARLQAGVVTPIELQQENSPVSFQEMRNARVMFRPRVRV
jgi:hypothetical protein